MIPNITGATPNSGREGTDIIIEGEGFNTNGTTVFSVKFGGAAGISAALLVEDDNNIRATVPPGAQTGKLFVQNADGTDESEFDFVIQAPVAPENTVRGQEALEKVQYAVFAKSQNNLANLAKCFNPARTLVSMGGNSVIKTAPPSSDLVATNAYRESLDDCIPNAFTFQNMSLLGSAAVIQGEDGGGVQHTFVLYPSISGYRISAVHIG